jgi:hypothetical protein
MSRGLTYMSLLASIKQNELLADGRRQRIGVTPVRPARTRRWWASLPSLRRASR